MSLAALGMLREGPSPSPPSTPGHRSNKGLAVDSLVD